MSQQQHIVAPPGRQNDSPDLDLTERRAEEIRSTLYLLNVSNIDVSPTKNLKGKVMGYAVIVRARRGAPEVQIATETNYRDFLNMILKH